MEFILFIKILFIIFYKKRCFELEKTYKTDLSKYTEDIQALFINFICNSEGLNEAKLKRLQELEISKKLMKNGIVFLWSEITILHDLIKIMEKKNFKYIEHFTIVHLNSKKAMSYLDANDQKNYQKILKEEAKIKKTHEKLNEDNSEDSNETEESTDFKLMQKVSSLDFLINKLNLKKNVKIDAIFSNEENENNFFRKSKSVLLMFRRVFVYYFLFYNRFLIKIKYY